MYLSNWHLQCPSDTYSVSILGFEPKRLPTAFGSELRNGKICRWGFEVVTVMSDIRTKFLFPLAFIVFAKCDKAKGRAAGSREGGTHLPKPQPNKHISIKTLDGSTSNTSKCNNSNNNNDCHVGGHVLRHGHNKVQS
ncbi:hypothetical protein ACLKA7_016287 [Drosophila subpalustris]